MIDRGADGVAIAAIIQAGGKGAMGNDIVIRHLVQGGGGDARFHQGHQKVQHFGGQAAGPAHALEFSRIVQSHGEVRFSGGVKNLGLG